MKALFKRRWVLLSCAVVLVACSCFDLRRHAYAIVAMSRSGTGEHLGLFRGEFSYFKKRDALRIFEPKWIAESHIERPQFGALPSWGAGATAIRVAIPLWLPLSAVLGWLVFRELRWREKRSKAAQAVP